MDSLHALRSRAILCSQCQSNLILATTRVACPHCRQDYDLPGDQLYGFLSKDKLQCSSCAQVFYLSTVVSVINTNVVQQNSASPSAAPQPTIEGAKHSSPPVNTQAIASIGAENIRAGSSVNSDLAQIRQVLSQIEFPTHQIDYTQIFTQELESDSSASAGTTTTRAEHSPLGMDTHTNTSEAVLKEVSPDLLEVPNGHDLSAVTEAPNEWSTGQSPKHESAEELLSELEEGETDILTRDGLDDVFVGQKYQGESRPKQEGNRPEARDASEQGGSAPVAEELGAPEAEGNTLVDHLQRYRDSVRLNEALPRESMVNDSLKGKVFKKPLYRPPPDAKELPEDQENLGMLAAEKLAEEKSFFDAITTSYRDDLEGLGVKLDATEQTDKHVEPLKYTIYTLIVILLCSIGLLLYFSI